MKFIFKCKCKEVKVCTSSMIGWFVWSWIYDNNPLRPECKDCKTLYEDGGIE